MSKKANSFRKYKKLKIKNETESLESHVIVFSTYIRQLRRDNWIGYRLISQRLHIYMTCPC